MKSRRQPRMGRSVFSLALIGGALMLVGASGSLEAQEGRYEQTDIEYGARLFGMHCIACHGENGDLVPQINLRSGSIPALSERSRSRRQHQEWSARHGHGPDRVHGFRNHGARRLRAQYRQGRSRLDQSRRRGARSGVVRRQRRLRQLSPGPRPRAALRAGLEPDRRDALRGPLERSLLGAPGGLIPINRPVRIVTRDGTVINGRRLNEDTLHGSARR